jgi:uncharacterized protein (TIGR03382 family)
MRMLVGILLVVGMATLALAQPPGPRQLSAPEVDPGSAISALAILGGAVLLRRRR